MEAFDHRQKKKAENKKIDKTHERIRDKKLSKILLVGIITNLSDVQVEAVLCEENQ